MSVAVQTREEFLAERQGYLGASDMGAILGVDLYRTQLDVYNEKVGLSQPFAGNRHTERGLKLEDVAANLYTELTGRKLRRRNQALVHPEYPFLVGHIDRTAVGDKRIVEIKCPSLGNYKKIQREGLPVSWIAQLQWYLLLSGYPTGEWALFCADQFDLITFQIAADPELQAEMVKRAVAFWNNHIIPRIPPAPIDADKPKLEFQKVAGNVTRRDDLAFTEAAQLLRDAYALKSESDDLMRLAKTRIKEVVENEYGKYEGGGLRLHFSLSPGHLSFDKKALAAAHPEIKLSDFEKRGEPFEVLKPYFVGGGE